MANDRDVLRALAGAWAERAASPVMDERRAAWTALGDLRPTRPMVLFETWTLEDYLADVTLECEDPALRGVEWRLRWTLRQVDEVGDDTVLEPLWRVGWHIGGSDYGLPIAAHHAADGSGYQHGYGYDHPVATPADLDRLRPREWTVDRPASEAWAQRLDDLFGDLLPVLLWGTENLHAGLTGDVFRLLGNENLLLWCYDEPDALRWLLAYLRDDRLAHYRWLEAEGLLGRNDHFCFVGSGSPGYTTALPTAAGPVTLDQLWVHMESQETAMVSPALFEELFLPAMAAVAAPFGLVYYGCCEPVHDRWAPIESTMPHVRKVSISPWCDQADIAAQTAGRVVLSRKPRPAPISGPQADWAALEADLDGTLAAMGHRPLEIVFRDVYRIHGDRPRLRRWVDLVRARIGGR